MLDSGCDQNSVFIVLEGKAEVFKDYDHGYHLLSGHELLCAPLLFMKVRGWRAESASRAALTDSTRQSYISSCKHDEVYT